MRATKSTILILIIAIMVACAAFLAVGSFAFAEDPTTYYLEADIDTPAVVYYNASAVSFDFTLWRSSDKTSWVEDTTNKSSFEIKYYDSARRVLEEAPIVEGTYFAMVISKTYVPGHKNTANPSQTIARDVVVGEKKFSIVRRSLIVNAPVIDDNSATLILDDLHTNYFDDIIDGVSVLKNDTELVKDTDYTATIEHYSTSWTGVAAVSSMGKYRLAITFLNDNAILDTVVENNLVEVADKKVLYYEFNVTRSNLSLSVSNTSMYEDSTVAVALDSDSINLLSSLSISYDTAVVALGDSGMSDKTHIVASQVGSAVSYTPTAVGNYIYRITFKSERSDRGISIGDYADIAFEVLPKPYYLIYRVNSSGLILGNELADCELTDGNTAINVSVTVADLDGRGLSAAYDVNGAKFTISYKEYNTAYIGNWHDIASAPSAAGRYKVVVTFNRNVIVKDDYTIVGGEATIIEKEFQICTVGSLNVLAPKDSHNYYTGSPVSPVLKFVSNGIEISSSEIDSLFQINYYNLDGSTLSEAPTAVGSYVYEVEFTSPASNYGVPTGAKYRGVFMVEYRPLIVSIDDELNITFTDESTNESVSYVEGTDYSVSHFEQGVSAFNSLTLAPTLPGKYAIRISFTVAKPLYNIAAQDEFLYVYTKASGAAASATLLPESISLNYDGGAKVVPVAFIRSGISTELVEGLDYKVSYYKRSAGDFVQCGYPLNAGTYKAVVYFLRTNDALGIVAGKKFSSASFVVSTAKINVKYDDLDLVYDGNAKTFTASLTKDSRPFDTSLISITYADDIASPIFASTGKVNVGNYIVKVSLNDDENGSLELVNAEKKFAISPLSLRVCFEIPTGYDAMWTGSAISPKVTYKALNGTSSDIDARDAAKWNDDSDIAIGESFTYYIVAENDETITTGHTLMNNYKMLVAHSNTNVSFDEVNSVSVAGEILSQAFIWTDGTANALFDIIPREVKVNVITDSDLYYTTEGKGVDSVSFLAYAGYALTNDTAIVSGKSYYTRSLVEPYSYTIVPELSLSVSDIDTYYEKVDYDEDNYVDNVSNFSGDYRIEYYSSDYLGNVMNNGVAASSTKPTAPGFYVARIIFDPVDATETYITENRYTFFGGKTSAQGESMNGSPVGVGDYFDYVFRIKQQEQMDVEFVNPSTFAFNDEPKAFNVNFGSAFSVITLTYGTDYELQYYDENDAILGSIPSAIGSYKVRLVFNRDNTAYHIDGYSGTISRANDLYVSSGDYIDYSYEIFAPRELNIHFVAPESLYYDGNAKDYSVNFTVGTGTTASYVLLTYDTHYKLVYYKKNGDGKYEEIVEAPTIPGDYAVEALLMVDLLDYSILVGAVNTPCIMSNFPSLKSLGGVIALNSPNIKTFEIKKAVLTVSGITAADKQFDGTKNIEFVGTPKLSVKTESNVALGAMVKENGTFPYSIVGEMQGSFVSSIPSDAPIAVDVSEYYTLSDGGADLYTLEFASFTANISPRIVKIKAIDVAREYNPFAAESVISYSYDLSESELTSLDLVLSSVVSGYTPTNRAQFVSGLLSREAGTDVGEYQIKIGTLGINPTFGTYTVDSLVVDPTTLFELSLSEAYYRIYARSITVAPVAGQEKIYGYADATLEYGVTVGNLTYRDTLSAKAVRATGENVGSYKISLSEVKILNGMGQDVSGNYNITVKTGNFEIKKRSITIEPVQEKNDVYYTDGFDITIRVLDRDKGVETTEFTNPTSISDRFSGKLAINKTSNPLVFNIERGSLIIVNSKKKDVSANYDIQFVDNKTYTMKKAVLEVKMVKNQTLEKYYGDADPIIAFVPYNDKDFAKALGDCKMSASSSIGRKLGENVGEYKLVSDNSSNSFVITDDGVDVSAYFEISVRNVNGFSTSKLVIKPRPITVTIQSAEYDNTGRAIIPTLKYLNQNGSKLSETVKAKLKVEYAVPEVEFHDGNNAITPIVIGDVVDDDNFDITVEPGIIKLNYLENKVTATAVENSDSMVKKNKYVFAGIMLYKTVKMYRLDTANGGQPTRDVDISLDATGLSGENLVAVALYNNKSPKAFTLKPQGSNLIYSDDGAYYVVIAETQEWFYVVWGVACIAILVVMFFIIRGFVIVGSANAAKKRARAIELAASGDSPVVKAKPSKQSKQKKKGASGSFVPTGDIAAHNLNNASAVTSETDNLFVTSDELDSSNDMFSSNPITDSKDTHNSKSRNGGGAFVPTAKTETVVAQEEVTENTDDLFVTGSEDEAKMATTVVEDDVKDKTKKTKKGTTSFAPRGFAPKPKTESPKIANDNGDELLSSDSMFVDSLGSTQNNTLSSKPKSSIEITNTDDLFSDSAVTDDSGDIIMPTTQSSSSDDDLVISRGNSFFTDDEEEQKDDDGEDKL